MNTLNTSPQLIHIKHPEMHQSFGGDKPLIIERSELQSKNQKIVYGVITLGFWALWLYLCLPLLSLLAWALGFNLLYKQMVLYGGYEGLLRVLGFYLLIIAILGGSLLLWAFYNYFRFRGMERRRASKAVDLDRKSTRLGLKPNHLMQWQKSKRLVIHYGPCCRIIGVEAKHQSWLTEELLKKKQKLIEEQKLIEGEKLQEQIIPAGAGAHHS